MLRPVVRDDRREERGNADRQQRPRRTSDQRVERSERSFVHSERTTRGCVTRPWREPRSSSADGAHAAPSVDAAAGLELDVVARELHERLLERGLLRRQLVQHDPVRGRGLADLLGA